MSGFRRTHVCNGCGTTLAVEAWHANDVRLVPAREHHDCPGKWKTTTEEEGRRG